MPADLILKVDIIRARSLGQEDEVYIYILHIGQKPPSRVPSYLNYTICNRQIFRILTLMYAVVE
jgi:hypothetical protein